VTVQEVVEPPVVVDQVEVALAPVGEQTHHASPRLEVGNQLVEGGNDGPRGTTRQDALGGHKPAASQCRTGIIDVDHLVDFLRGEQLRHSARAESWHLAARWLRTEDHRTHRVDGDDPQVRAVLAQATCDAVDGPRR
jgi:hypothetical protein